MRTTWISRACLAVAIAALTGCPDPPPMTSPTGSDTPWDDLETPGGGAADAGGGDDLSARLQDTRRLSDGAEAILPGNAKQRAQARFERVADAPATPAGEKQVVTGTYRVSLPSKPERGFPLMVRLPVDPARLPADFDPMGLVTEWKVDGQWRTVAAMKRYDPGSHRLALDLPLDLPGGTGAAGYALSQATGAWTIEVRALYLLSRRQTVRRAGSRFRIHYYPARTGQAYEIPDDDAWASTSGDATDPAVPDYVEDVDAALNQSLDRLLTYQSSEGALFTTPADLVDVTLTDTGGNGGDSGLGGPINLQARGFTSYLDMHQTAAHELVHVLQRPFYSAFWTPFGLAVPTAGLNWWFIEAVANHYAARAVGLDEAARLDYYTEFYRNYLSTPLTTRDDQSMYAAGDFLDYLSTRVDDRVVGDALRGGAGNDLVALSRVLRDRGVAGGVSEAFGDYVEAIVTTPERTGGLGNRIKANMIQHAAGQLLPEFGDTYQAANVLTDAITYTTVRKPLGVLSAIFTNWEFRNADNALLVVDTGASQGRDLRTLAHDFYGLRDADYARARPINAAAPPSTTSWTIPNVGRAGTRQAEWLVTNTSITTRANLDAAVYLLRPPVVVAVRNGGVDIDLTPLGNLPRARLAGVVLQGPDGAVQAPVAVPAVGGRMTVPLPGVQAGESVVAAFEDTFGNRWPEIDEDAAPAPRSPAGLLAMTQEIALSWGALVRWSGQQPTFLPGNPKRFTAVNVSGNTFSATLNENDVKDGSTVHSLTASLGGTLSADGRTIERAEVSYTYEETDSGYGEPTYKQVCKSGYALVKVPFSRVEAADDALPTGSRFTLVFGDSSAPGADFLKGFWGELVTSFPRQGPDVDPFSGVAIPTTPPVRRTAEGLEWGGALAGPNHVQVHFNGTVR